MNAFKQFILDNYSFDQLFDMARFGRSGGVEGMVYYSETSDIYRDYAEELHDILEEYRAEMDEMPGYITDALGNHMRFENSVVWFCAEWIAQKAVADVEALADSEE